MASPSRDVEFHWPGCRNGQTVHDGHDGRGNHGEFGSRERNHHLLRQGQRYQRSLRKITGRQGLSDTARFRILQTTSTATSATTYVPLRLQQDHLRTSAERFG